MNLNTGSVAKSVTVEGFSVSIFSSNFEGSKIKQKADLNNLQELCPNYYSCHFSCKEVKALSKNRRRTEAGALTGVVA